MDGQPASVVVAGSQNVVGNHLTNVGNTYNIHMGAGYDSLPALRERVVPEAMHDSKDVVDQGTCHPGTRIAVLEDINAWIERRDPGSALKWMRGAAGAGKSAIARTFANQLASRGLLLASFFCLRSKDRRSNASMVIPTLVDQILSRIRSIRPIIAAAFRDDQHLLTKSMEIQATRLIIEPLESIEPALCQSLPRVIVIDGLDEIKGAEAQRDILKTVAFLIDNLSFPIHFFISSRPEHQIQDYFTQSMGGKWSVISLDDTYHPDRDIIIFYKAHFPLIVAAFPAFKLEPDWPGEVARRVLVTKGSGQFIFADIVIRFLGNTSISISPQRRLDMILENVANDKLKPLELLDLVYVTVFEAVPKEEREHVLQLVGLVLLPVDFTKSPLILDALLFLEPGTTLNRLRYLHSVLEVPSSPGEAIAPLHATLGDFIFNYHRSRSFDLHINQEQFHQGIIVRILKDSLVHPASERLIGYYGDWLTNLYTRPMSIFANDPTFRTTLASHISEVQDVDIKLWSPLALLATYRIAMEILKAYSSWRDYKERLFWRSMRKNSEREVSRRMLSYVNNMGVTGQMILFLHLLSHQVPRFHGSNNMHTFLKALPDQDVLASEKHLGMDLLNRRPEGSDPSLDLDNVRREAYYLLTKPLLEPTFLETLFTNFPWHLPLPRSYLTIDSILDAPIPLLFSPTDGNIAIFRLLSLRDLPQNNSRWSDSAKFAFSRFLDRVVEEGARRKANNYDGPKYEAAKKTLLERAAAWQRKNAGR